jgi:hypothetical protein
MIIIKIQGGLGNQMFQYAAAKCLAEQHHTQVKLDIDAIKNDQLRDFDLFRLNVKAAIATDEEVTALKATNRYQRIRSYITAYDKRKFYKQPYFHFDPRFFKLGSSVYLQGYFQSEKYFRPIQNIIRNEFTVEEKLINPVRPFAEQLQKETSIALHIRRGDYQNETALNFHGILPLTYYQSAIRLLQQQLHSSTTYIFSDDGEWVKQSLNLPHAAIVSGNYTTNHFEDFFLMSKCRHNIIANSSFSWWAAWMNNNPEKIIVAPERWFNQGPKDIYDLLPKDWIRL